MTTDHETVTETVVVAPADPETPSAIGTTPAALWVERTGTRTYTGRSSRGAEVLIGPVEAGAVFTPGELLKIALAGCSGMTADAALARRLGDDVAVTVRVSGQSDPVQDRYEHLREELVVDLSGLDDATRARLLTVVTRAIDQHCTVARTLTNGATVDLTIEGEG
jgi:uncharacterized OsmC-like protein